MSKKEFSHLLQKYLDDQCSDQEKKLVESWFTLLDDEHRWQSFDQSSLKNIEQRLWLRLQDSIHATNSSVVEPPTKSKVVLFGRFWQVAAAIILVTGSAVIYQYLSAPNTASLITTNWIKKVNETGKPLTLVLEDGSTLQLTKGTTVYYPGHFSANKRELKIEGTAFCEIVKDSARPFYVHSQEIVTKVLGTSFWVVYNKARHESAVEVVTGKVAVYKSETNNTKPLQTDGVLLKPNEKVVFNTEEETFTTALVDDPVPVRTDSSNTDSEMGTFIYDDTPLSTVARDLENEYGISIILEAEEMNDQLFTGNISSLDYFTKLKTICRSLGVTYETKGNRILIQRK